ncbi:dTDP-4-dehydrorhamnose 3,5-epimerase family protein [Stappia sp.]|uniref:dTDP-4-dehydrorhamnose 3,5-epimerase family protein n=1 Tax=Stappia sp. TaxID=1870903 RepID=UPI0035B50A70
MLDFTETGIAGLVRVETGAHEDARGAFMRLFCPQEFEAAGIVFPSSQINLSTNHRRHTLRGMHWQDPPHAEAKIVRVVAGAIFDVVADLRPDSPSYGKWEGFDLSAENRRALVIPQGCAHGFLTLADDTSVLYQMDRLHVPGQARGFRYDDPAFAIDWPAEPAVISEADLAWPAFTREA